MYTGRIYHITLNVMVCTVVECGYLESLAELHVLLSDQIPYPYNLKVDNLKKRYKVEREKRRVSGSASKWPFYDMMDDLIGANPRHMRGGGGAAAIGGEDSPLAIENGTPLGIRSSGDGERLYYLDTGVGGEGDQTSETIPRISPVYGRGRRKRALEDLERERINGPSLRALFEGYNVPLNIIDAMIQEDMDDSTLINSKDISSLLDQLRMKHRIQLKLGPAERIKQAIEVAKEKKMLALEQ